MTTTVNTSSSKVIDSGRNPKKIIFSNIGLDIIWISRGSAAVVEEGFPIMPNQALILDRFSGGELNSDFYAITASESRLSAYVFSGSL